MSEYIKNDIESEENLFLENSGSDKKEILSEKPEDVTKNTKCNCIIKTLEEFVVKLNEIEENIKIIQEKVDSVAELRTCMETLQKNSIDNRKLYEERVDYSNRNMRLLEQMLELFKRVHSLEERCSTVEGTFPDETAWQGIQKGIHNLHKATLRRLSANGIVPICPMRNDEVDEELHRIVHQMLPRSPDDLPGRIAETWEIGEMRDGVVWKCAEVCTFVEPPADDADSSPEELA